MLLLQLVIVIPGAARNLLRYKIATTLWGYARNPLYLVVKNWSALADNFRTFDLTAI